MDFFNVPTGPELLQKTEALLPEHRNREYPPTVTLAVFLKQALSQDRSCQRAVDDWIAQCVAEGLKPPSSRTGGYSRARGRLPTPMVTALTHASGELLCGQSPAGWRWRGWVAKLGDGTGLSMPDTAENQARYPQPSSQAEGVGFPLMRLTRVIYLSTGAVLDVAMGPHAGKGSSERLGAREHIVRWEKPETRPEWMSQQEYRAFPPQLIVREVKMGGRVQVTSMHDPRKAPKREPVKLYERR